MTDLTLIKQYHESLISTVAKQRWKDKDKILSTIQRTYIAVLEDRLTAPKPLVRMTPGPFRNEIMETPLLSSEEQSALSQATSEDEDKSDHGLELSKPDTLT